MWPTTTARPGSAWSTSPPIRPRRGCWPPEMGVASKAGVVTRRRADRVPAGDADLPADLWIVDVAGGEPRQLTAAAAVADVRNALIMPEKVTYRSFDGLEIAAYLYAPPDRGAGRRYPCLLRIHGGPTSQYLDTLHGRRPVLCPQRLRGAYAQHPGQFRLRQGFEDANNGDWGHDDLRDVPRRGGIPQDAGLRGRRRHGHPRHQLRRLHEHERRGLCAGRLQGVGAPCGLRRLALTLKTSRSCATASCCATSSATSKTHREVYQRCSPIYSLAQATTPVSWSTAPDAIPARTRRLSSPAPWNREYKTFDYKIYPDECYYVLSAANLGEMYPDILEFLDRYVRL